MLTPACKASKAVLVEMLPTFEAARDVGALGRIAGDDTLRLDLKGKCRPAAPCAARWTPWTTNVLKWVLKVALFWVETSSGVDGPILPRPAELSPALCACRLHLQHANV